MTEDSILGYDLYSSALAEILSEPSLNTPITVGLYAKWGSGKSFLLSQLKAEMKSFARLTRVVALRFNALLIVTVLAASMLVTAPFCYWKLYYGLALFALVATFALVVVAACVYFYNEREREWAKRACNRISLQLDHLKLLLRILFVNPQQYSGNGNHGSLASSMEHKTLRFIFTEYGKISTIGGESAFALMIGSMNAKLEDEFGTVITRICRAFYEKSNSASSSSSSSRGKFRHICCIPTFLLVCALFAILCGLAVFARLKNFELSALSNEEQTVAATFAFVALLAILGSSFTWLRIVWHLMRSPQAQIMRAARQRNKKYHNINTFHSQFGAGLGGIGGGAGGGSSSAKTDSFIFKLKHEVDLIAHTVIIIKFSIF